MTRDKKRKRRRRNAAAAAVRSPAFRPRVVEARKGRRAHRRRQSNPERADGENDLEEA